MSGDEIDLSGVEEILSEFTSATRADTISILQRTQEVYGYLPPEVLEEVSERTGIPLSSIMGVATFYEQFSLIPKGRHTVQVCVGTCCHVRGARRVLSAVKRALGVDVGGTTDDRLFTLETVSCFGSCAFSPVIAVDHEFYGKMTPEKVPTVLEGYR